MYIADRRIRRGSFQAVFDSKWNQDLKFFIPVSSPKFWNQHNIKTKLQDIFQFAVGHHYIFNFVQDKGINKQLFVEEVHQSQVEQLNANCISLFSGGLDSLASTLELLIDKKQKPLLLAHTTAGKVKTYRNTIYQQLKSKYTGLTKWEITICSKKSLDEQKTNIKEESSQRSRSILYACLGIGFARCLNIKEVYLSDNGIITLNLPSTESNKSTQLTRSTNPKLIEYINNLSTTLWKDKAPKIDNLLLWKTKSDVVKQILDYGYKGLISQTISCVDTRSSSKEQPFCGQCSQCFERRFAVKYNLINESDKYRFDIFKDCLDNKPVAKTHYENFFRRGEFFQENQNNIIAIYNKYSEIIEFCSSNFNEQEFLEKVTKLYVQHFQEIQTVIGQFGHSIISRDFRQNSLLDIEYRKHLYKESSQQYEQRNNNPEINYQSKPFRLIVCGKSLYVKEKEVKISGKQFEIIYALFLSPEKYLSYSYLLDGVDIEENNSACSAPMQDHKKEINKQVKRTSERALLKLPLGFTTMKSRQRTGYKIDEWFFVNIQPK